MPNILSCPKPDPKSGSLLSQCSCLQRAFKHLAVVEEESRLLPRLARLANNAYSGKQYAGKESDGRITRHMIDQVRHFCCFFGRAYEISYHYLFMFSYVRPHFRLVCVKFTHGCEQTIT